MTSAKSHSFSPFWDCGGLETSARRPSAIDPTIEGSSRPASPVNRNQCFREAVFERGAAVKMTSAKSHPFSLFWDCGGLETSARRPSAIDPTIEGLSRPDSPVNRNQCFGG
jgi:hypothetical protein